MSNKVTKDSGNFSMIPNELLTNRRISLAAKGLYAFMYGKPDGWNFTIRSMAKQLKEGVTAISNALNELKEFGWISYSKHTDGTGSYHLSWSLPDAENPDQGFTNLGKSACINKKDQLERYINTTPNPKGSGGGGDKIPTKAIHDLYNSLCPDLPRSMAMTPKRERQIKARWKEDSSRQNIGWWEGFFKYVHNVPFLNGNNDRGWKADLEWITNPNNFVKVAEGKYQHD